MKKILLGLFAVSVLLFSTAAVFAAGGFDQFGYNYKANIFNGNYCNYDRVMGGEFCDVHLQMKWNDAWLNENRERHVGYDSYIGSGAWLTNHDVGVNEDGSTWTYFVKIIAKPSVGFACPDSSEIWGDFCVIQQVVTGNPPSDFMTYDGWPFPGNYKSPLGPGLGNR